MGSILWVLFTLTSVTQLGFVGRLAGKFPLSNYKIVVLYPNNFILKYEITGIK